MYISSMMIAMLLGGCISRINWMVPSQYHLNGFLEASWLRVWNSARKLEQVFSGCGDDLHAHSSRELLLYVCSTRR